MPTYLVTWIIDIEADTPRDAAQKALEIQRDPESIATVFEVKGRAMEAVSIDLSEPSAQEFASFIAVSADSIDQLRFDDVERVIREAPAHHRASLAAHIKDARSDLADEVDEVMAEWVPAR